MSKLVRSALVSLVVIFVVGCATPIGDGSNTTPPASFDTDPSAAVSEGAESSQSAQPSGATYPPAITAPTGILPPGSEAVAAVNGLRVRSGRPGEDGFDEVVTTLSEGDPVTIHPFQHAYLSPALSPDGRGWYLVHAGGRDAMSYIDGGIDGWVAEGEAGLEYLTIRTAPCPGPDPGIDALLSYAVAGSNERDQRFEPWDRLACYGGDQIELEGMIDLLCQGAYHPGVYEPELLAYPTSCIGIGVENSDAEGLNPGGLLPLRIAAGVYDEWQRGDIVRLRGHFDDPAASSCRAAPEGLGPAPDSTFLVLFCREQFVVEEVDVREHRDLPPLS